MISVVEETLELREGLAGRLWALGGPRLARRHGPQRAVPLLARKMSLLMAH